MTHFERELRDHGVILGPSHFVFSHGWHTRYFAHGEALGAEHAAELRDYCRRAKELVSKRVAPPDVVVGPDRGGVAIAYFMAAEFAACAVVALKDGKGGYLIETRFRHLLKSKHVLLVDDVVTTCHTLQKVVGAVHEAEGLVVASAVIWAWVNKERKTEGLGQFITLGEGELEHWSAEECAKSGPCAEGVEVNIIHGHGAEFLARRAQPLLFSGLC